MTSALCHRYGRALSAGALSVALLSGGTAGAVAAPTAPSPAPTTRMASLTARADRSTVRLGDMVTFSGQARGLRAGTRVALQRDMNGRWTTLKTVILARNGTYSVPVKANLRGLWRLRAAAGAIHSRDVTVRVR